MRHGLLDRKQRKKDEKLIDERLTEELRVVFKILKKR